VLKIVLAVKRAIGLIVLALALILMETNTSVSGRMINHTDKVLLLGLMEGFKKCSCIIDLLISTEVNIGKKLNWWVTREKSKYDC